MNNDCEKVETIIGAYNASRDSLISILQDIQSEYHYLPEDALRAVASQLELPLIRVYGVATFFKAFSLKPRGEHIVTVCLGTACHVRGARDILETAQHLLGIKTGQTTEDYKYSLERVACVGSCAMAPIIMIDSDVHPKVSPLALKFKLMDKLVTKDKKKPTKGR